MTNLDSIALKLKKPLDMVRNTVQTALESDIDLINKTNGQMLSHSGKYLRPILALLCVEYCAKGFYTRDTINYAAASELLHNATLLHDDVADNGLVRRGRPTVLSLLGGRASVLLGDYWLVKAVELILSAKNDSERVIRLYAKTLSDLADGELLQLQNVGTEALDIDVYERIIYCKTASLFQTTATAAAISVSTPEVAVTDVRLYAINLGMAFQVKDDILDYTAGEELGKPLLQDLREQKMTLPLLGALAQASKSDREDALRLFVESDSHPEHLESLLAFVLENKGIDYAQSRVDRYTHYAKESLQSLDSPHGRQLLCDFADILSARGK